MEAYEGIFLNDLMFTASNVEITIIVLYYWALKRASLHIA